MEQANTKYSHGYASTGAILCLCARHEMVEPNGTVNTTKGEKYGLSDYAVGASQRHSDKKLFQVLSYNIACQYHKKFFNWMEHLPQVAQISLHQDHWKFTIPKLHIQGHKSAFTQEAAGCSQANGYSCSRAVGLQQKSRIDCRYLEADCITEQDVWLKYAQLEEEDQKAGVPALHDVSSSAFILMGLEIEEQQQQLAYDLKQNEYVTSLQKTEVLEHKAKLIHAIAHL
ncbi:hypothetical protein Moror_11102 [Moniliophthora roreri MCA 2997]|uniref:Uncharacterized protein n=1 Tax=Moniliophthora roreri (strain MCA 2997) TaxID=1381753 RepID=V2WQ13_MONRO|nr:hypothetical protein Moror_11102 [Moniliophthora roreri MCA 2997]